MNITRREILAGLVAIPFSLGTRFELGAQTAPKVDLGLTGSWVVTSAQNSVILSIEPDGQALVLLLERGLFSYARTKWRPLPGGLLVGSFPRFRLWAGSDHGRLRAEMDLPQNVDVSDSWREFPETFFMSRVPDDANIPKVLSERPLPAGWDKETLDKEWDQKAGKRRPRTPSGAKRNAVPNAAPRER